MLEITKDQVPDPPSLEELQSQERMTFDGVLQLPLAAVTPDGKLIAYGTAVGGKFNKPGHFRIFVRVDRPYRGESIGRTLYQALEQYALEQGATALECTVREENPESLAWAERRGYVKEHHLFESKLFLDRFDPKPFAGAVERALASGIHFTTLAEYPLDDTGLERYLDFMWELALDVPGTEGQPKPSLADFRKFIENNPAWKAEHVLLAVDGDRWVAMAEMRKQANGAYYHGFTGVQRDYRGRGMALAIKLVFVDWAREQGAPYLRTHNHSVNQRMLAVNRKMGYQPEPGMFQLIRKV